MFIPVGICSRNRGFMMVELAMAMVLMAIAISPMIAALSPSIHILSSRADISVITTRVFGTLNRVAGLDYTTLESNKGKPASLSDLMDMDPYAPEYELKDIPDTPTYTPTVNIEYATGVMIKKDCDTGETIINDINHNEIMGKLLEVSVTQDNITLKTLRANF